MNKVTIVVLKVIIALCLAGSLFVEGFMLPLVWMELGGPEDYVPLSQRLPFVLIIGGGVICLQVFAVCVWRLLTFVRRGSVFTQASFRYVDVIIGAILVAGLLVFGLAVLFAPTDLAPGVVGLICGLALVLGGVALLVRVMRQLLVQATALRTELDEVI